MDSLKNILCPVDFSASSYDAVEKASFLAQLLRADLTLLHVVSVLPQSFGVVYGLDLDSQNLVADAETKIRELLRQVKQRYVPYVVSCKSVIREGRVADEIIAQASESQTDLIIMATHGLHLSESISTVISHAPCPVVAFQRLPSEEGVLEQHKGFRKILIPIDAEHPAKGIAELEGQVGRYLGMMSPEVVLLSVLQPGSLPEQQRYVQTLLETEGQLLVNEGVHKVTVKVMEGKGLGDHIGRLALLEGCDLILMQAGVPDAHDPRMALTQHVVSSARVPVFALR
ncbi:MAG: hypothetical protein OHK0039_38670 [Bacteroidia bacterium]